ncbi:hypothetical protein JRQ81_008200 [Phrynocephalus forsythii]|uniref:SH3 domain-containing protein n=1 Tax=Phrynocephalus forsythii TaxID=171643 RepID=A0A9Q0XBF8_9SAUR|nr:hypothetical protein JRQ81_008200 [Phrynocephalus forsythii]
MDQGAAIDKQRTDWFESSGELHVVRKGYTAAQEDEITLKEGETIEVIHKLLDGWWVVRKDEATGYYPSMYLQKLVPSVAIRVLQPRLLFSLPSCRSTIRNIKSMHNQSRRQISQETYRRNSVKYMQSRKILRGNLLNKKSAIAENDEMERNQTKAQPAVPPRPSKALILNRCSESTKSKIK